MSLVMVGFLIKAGPWLMITAAVAMPAFCFCCYAADAAIREVRRLANNAVAPVMTCLSEVKNGAPLIRAMHFTHFFAKRQSAFIEEWVRLNMYSRYFIVWMSHTASFVSTVIGGGSVLILIGTRHNRQPSENALGLTYAGFVPYFTTVVTEMFIFMRAGLSSLERLLEYQSIEQEAPHVRSTDPDSGTWPSGGAIQFDNVSMRYRPGLPLALDSFSASVPSRQKVGIVGRTGAGKSTLVLALFRLVEPAGGRILVDGIDVTGLGLRALRRCVTIIPQDPVLHEGTVGHNLDPFGEAADNVLDEVLVRARLGGGVTRQSTVTKGGTNLSSGERQLLCFARALLESAPILVLDEATSNLDAASDEAIQQLLRDEFERQTVLTIAHRLATVVDYDRILVMGGGKLLEQGAPLELLDAEGSVLAGMGKALGTWGEAALREKAKKTAAGKVGGAGAK